MFPRRLAALLLICLATGLLPGWAQAAPAAARPAAPAGSAPAESPILPEPRFETVGSGAPVPLNVVSALAQDKTGFLWIGTGAGLVRFDGYHFRQPNPPLENGQKSARSMGFIRSLLVARDGRIWIGTEADGLAAYDPATEQLSLFRSDLGQPRSAISAGTIRALAEDRDGSLWIGTIGHGLDHFDPVANRFRHFRKSDETGSLPDDRVQALLVDRQGTLWVGSWQGLSRKRAGASRFERVFSSPGQPGLAGKIVQSLFEAPDGRIWVGTQQGDLALVDPASGVGLMLETAAEAINGAVNSVVALDHENLWLGRSGGLELRDARTGQRLRTMKHDPLNPASLGGNEVRALLRDRSGWIWTGGYGGGLQRHNPANTSTWVRGRDQGAQAQLVDPSTRSLLQLDNGEIWLGSNESGVTMLDEQLRSIGALRPAPGQAGGLSGGRVSSMAQMRDGSVWLGSDGGLHQFSRDKRLLRVVQLGAGRARRLMAGSGDTLWIATQDGLFRLPAGAATPQRLGLEGGQPLTGDVNALVETPDHALWIGTEKGVYRLDPGASALIPVRAQPGHDLSHHSVVGLLLDRQQRLWVDTSAGLHKLASWDGREARFENISERHGMVGRAFGANMLEDATGRIWTHQFVYDPEADRYSELTAADGVDIGTGWFRSYIKTRDGRMLFGGSKGVLVVTPERFQAWAYLPPLVASELRVDGQRLPAGQLARGLTIAAHNRSFSIEFAALDFSDPDRNRYAYQLQGFDPDWIPTGADLRVAGYTNLDPGHYTLKVRGSNRSGDWSTQELSIPIEVLPDWWQTWWARTLAVAALLAAVYAVVALRTAYLRRLQLALEQKVSERTAELESLSRDLQAKTVALEESSLSDPLTGLRNRRFLAQHIDADVALSLRAHEASPPHEDGDLIFFLVDLDHFKAVNDQHGHAAGDAVLLQMRGRLQPVFRDSDYLVRWGGEEFLIVARATSRQHAAGLAERALALVAGQPFDLGDGRQLQMTCSVGFAAFPLSPRHPRALDWAGAVALADEALYAVKRSGRNGWEGVLDAPELDDATLRRRSREPMADWLASGELSVLRSRPTDNSRS